MPIAMTHNYSEETEGARVCLEKSFDLIQRALAATGDSSSRFTFCDYGAADGGTAMSLYRLIAELQGKQGLKTAILNDLPGNDFGTLGRNGRQAFAPYGYLVYLAPFSFYEPVVAPHTVDFGFSATAMHWLSSPPPTLANHTHGNACADARARAAFAEQAQADWRRLLTLRAQELRPGGELVTVNLARNEDDLYLGKNGRDHNMHDVLHDIWLELHRENLFDTEAYRAATFQNYYKGPDEFAAPLKEEGADTSLRLVEMRTEITPCFYREAFNQHGDAKRFAEGLMRTVRSWSRHTFSTALAGHDRAEAIVDELYARYQSRIEREPDRHSMDYVHNFLRVKKEA
ncbi:MAG: SAM-dependent methyltransferase [Myxococcota bacterium]